MASRVSCGVLEIQISFDMLPLLSAGLTWRTPTRQIGGEAAIPLPGCWEGLGETERKPGQRRVILREESSEILCAMIPAKNGSDRDRPPCCLAFQGYPRAKSRGPLRPWYRAGP